MRIRLQGSGHAARLLSELNRCRVSRVLCDVELQVGGRCFAAHRAVLACSCAHFSGLLSAPALPDTLALDFVSPTAFEKLLTFIYTGEIFTDLIDVGVLYELAERLGVSELVKACHATFPDLQSSAPSSSGASCCSQSSSAPTPVPQRRVPASPKSEEPPADAALPLPLKTEAEDGDPREPLPDSSAQLGESCAPSSSSIDPLDSLTLSAVTGPVSDSRCFQEALQEGPARKAAGAGWHADVIELSDEEEEDEEELMCVENGETGSCLPCGSCGTLLPVENEALRAHAETHLSDAGVCEVCGSSFGDRAAAVAHALTHVGILVFSCDVCEQPFGSESALVHHRRQSAARCVPQSPEQLDGATQRPGGELQCAICAKALANDFKAVRDHLQTHVCVRTLRCGVCQRAHPSRCALLWHTLTHLLPLHTCPQCACPFLQRAELQRHLLLHQSAAPPPERSCFLCPQTFRSDAAFHCHLSGHSGELTGHAWAGKRKAEALEFSSSSSSPLEAGGSGKTAFGVSLGFSLQDKMGAGGAFNGSGAAGLREKLYRCRYCGKHFAHSGEFTYHLRIHTGEKPYQCKVCLRFFRGRSTMICHLKTHAGALMYRCTVCGLFFSTLKMVSSHMELHKDQLPDDFNIEETFMYNDHSKDPMPSLES